MLTTQPFHTQPVRTLIFVPTLYPVPCTQCPHSLAHLHSPHMLIRVLTCTHSPNIHFYSFTPSRSHQNGYSCARPNPYTLTFSSMHMLTTSYTHPTCTLRCLPPSHSHPTYTLSHSHLATFTKHTVIYRHPQLPTCTLTYSCHPTFSPHSPTCTLICSRSAPPHDMYIQVLTHTTSTQHTYL